MVSACNSLAETLYLLAPTFKIYTNSKSNQLSLSWGCVTYWGKMQTLSLPHLIPQYKFDFFFYLAKICNTEGKTWTERQE